MSACKQRHEKRKAERTRRRRSWFNPKSAIQNPKSVAAALAAAAVIAAGTQAYADPVRFDNPAHADPGHFHWPVETPPGGRKLDIALAASQQPGGTTPTALSQFIGADYGQVGQTGGLTAQVQVGGFYNLFLVGVNGGELIPSGAPWGDSGLTYYPGYGSELPEGQATYLGVRFDVGGGSQYGWIGVERAGLELETFAWGYETEVGVAIPAGIPEPGSLALLAFGALAVCRRRR